MYGAQVDGSKWEIRKHKTDASRDRKNCDDEDTARCYMIAVGADAGKGTKERR